MTDKDKLKVLSLPITRLLFVGNTVFRCEDDILNFALKIIIRMRYEIDEILRLKYREINNITAESTVLEFTDNLT